MSAMILAVFASDVIGVGESASIAQDAKGGVSGEEDTRTGVNMNASSLSESGEWLLRVTGDLGVRGAELCTSRSMASSGCSGADKSMSKWGKMGSSSSSD